MSIYFWQIIRAAASQPKMLLESRDRGKNLFVMFNFPLEVFGWTVKIWKWAQEISSFRKMEEKNSNYSGIKLIA